MKPLLGLVLRVCAFACATMIQGSAVPPVHEGTPGSASSAPVPQQNDLQPSVTMPPILYAPVPQTTEGFPPPKWPSPLASPPSPTVSSPGVNIGPAPSVKPQHHPPFTAQIPAPIKSPPNSLQPNKQIPPATPIAVPPNTHWTNAPTGDAPRPATAPVIHVAPPRGMTVSPQSSPQVFPGERPSLPPDASDGPVISGKTQSRPPVQNEQPARSPEQNASPVLAAPSRISNKTAAMPAVNRTANHYAPVSQFPTQAPTASQPSGNYKAYPPHQFSKSIPGSHSRAKHHHAKVYNIALAPAPASLTIPPMPGFSSFAPPVPSPYQSSDNHYSLMPVSPASPSPQTKIPLLSPKLSPSGSSRSHKSPELRVRALPPPPPRTDCEPLACMEPLTYGPPESPCVCVLPIHVGLRVSIASYTFFPLVSELAAEIAAGVFMKQSQICIIGANAAEDDPETTIVLVDLLPLGEKFDDTTAYFTYKRFWNRQVVIKSSLFGSYDVLYVRYPGLLPSPPLPPSAIGTIASKPYLGRDNNTGTLKPLGVDVSQKQHHRAPTGSILATIILSCFAAIILLGAVLWVLLLQQRHRVVQPDSRSLEKSPGILPVSMVESGPSSPSFSLGSSIAAYIGSARTFSSSDIERATDFFNKTRILGEGGFGRVYSGKLDDGTEVAVKILKRCDQQGGREFMAEVEMLSRLHHRNLVKLIGICVEDRIRCLVYELIPNGSVESHLHGLDKDQSPLDWSARLKIALGAARALAYLHEDSSPRVIHRDFKASNILLENDFTPKVSDFGLARTALDEGNKHISTRVVGTFGYVAPEYAMTGHLLVKSDVYSYGVVLLELLTGRKPIDMYRPPGQENLVSWARPLLTTREGLELIVDTSLWGDDAPSDSVAKVAAIASMCVQAEVSDRPFMSEVVQALRLVCNECERAKDLLSRNSSHDNFSTVVDARNSTTSTTLLASSPVLSYDYQVDLDRDFSMFELLSSSANFEPRDSTGLRRYSVSGPLRTTGKANAMWKAMRRLSRGSVSEHGGVFKMWPSSH